MNEHNTYMRVVWILLILESSATSLELKSTSLRLDSELADKSWCSLSNSERVRTVSLVMLLRSEDNTALNIKMIFQKLRGANMKIV